MTTDSIHTMGPAVTALRTLRTLGLELGLLAAPLAIAVHAYLAW